MKKIISILCFLSLGLSSASAFAYQFCLENSIKYPVSSISAAIFSTQGDFKWKFGEVNGVHPDQQGCINFSDATLSKLKKDEAPAITFEITGVHDRGEHLKPVTCSISYPAIWDYPEKTTAAVTANTFDDSLNCQISASNQ